MLVPSFVYITVHGQTLLAYSSSVESCLDCFQLILPCLGDVRVHVPGVEEGAGHAVYLAVADTSKYFSEWLYQLTPAEALEKGICPVLFASHAVFLVL